MEKKKAAIVECLLFVAGEPVLITEIARVLEQDEASTKALLFEMELNYREEGRGICLLATEDTAQLVSNRDYIRYVEALLQPEQKKNISQSILETLAVIAYKQPVTRAEIESVRGVRCEYAVSQLQKLGLIAAVGRKDVIGKPMLYATTDTFLHKFGMHNLSELPVLPSEEPETVETV